MTSQPPGASLGNVVKIFKNNALTSILVIAGIGIALMAVALFIGIDWSTNSFPPLMCTTGIFILAGALIGLPGAIRGRGTTISVTDQGLIYKDRKVEIPLRWEDITVVQRHYTHGSRGSITLRQFNLQGRNGEQIYFNPNNLSSGMKLGQYIEQKSMEHLLPAYKSTYDSGQTVSFGAVLLSTAGIGCRSDFLRWDQVKSVHLRSWYFAINEKGLTSAASAEVTQIPNSAVLIALIAQVAGPDVEVTQLQAVELK